MVRNPFRWRATLWLLLGTVLLPAVFSVSVGILILVFYRESWDVAFGVLVLCFAVAALTGSSFTVFLLRRSARLASLQSEFIANMSHDLRTPLTSIRMFVETLRAQRVVDPEQQGRCLDLLAQETQRMERLVNQVLTWRHVEQTGGTYQLSPQDPEALVRSALVTYELDHRQKERLELVVEPLLPLIMADEEAMGMALRVLVDNALKYGGPGKVVVTVHADGEGIAISIRDQGDAIPRKERSRIFKRFYRTEGTEPKGTGLGLAIAVNVAQSHGGTVELKSTRGMGNVFTLRLPLVISGPVGDEPVAVHALEPVGSMGEKPTD